MTADHQYKIAAEIERVIGGYPDNGTERPKVETGQYLNDWQWAAKIARDWSPGCDTCSGTGIVLDMYPSPHGPVEREFSCPDCGTGEPVHEED